MDELKQRIRAEGVNLGNGILKIDSLLNHQIDCNLIKRCGEEIARRYRDAGITRVLTAEVSGIAPSYATSLALGVPLVYARKVKPVTISGPVFLETAPSHTKGVEVNLIVAAEFMPPGERVLVIDDFLASGKTIRSLIRIVQSANATVAGVAAVVEKTFEGGRDSLLQYNVRIESLAMITAMHNGVITFADD